MQNRPTKNPAPHRPSKRRHRAANDDQGGPGPTVPPISASRPMADPAQPTHYRVSSGGHVAIITDPYEVAIATIESIRALTASAIRTASSDPVDQRSEP